MSFIDKEDFMTITLKDLIEKNIFEQYEIISGQNVLDREIKNVSILETPDFENYIIEESIIITTLYPIKNELSLATKLLYALKRRNTAGLIIKLHRYIDDIPTAFISVANELNIPVVTLNYDVNLSILFNNILTEIQLVDFSPASFEESYSLILQKIYDNPTIDNLIESIKEIENFELLIENLDNNSIQYSSIDVINYYQLNKNTSALIQRVQKEFYFIDNISYEGRNIFKIVFLAREERSHIIHNMIEVFRLLIKFIYQIQLEQFRRQNSFLMNFVTAHHSTIANDLSSFAKEFNWNIQFPIFFIVMSYNDSIPELSFKLIELSRSILTTRIGKRNNEFKLTQIGNQIIFILNSYPSDEIKEDIKFLYESISNAHPLSDLHIAYSDNILSINDVTQTYKLISESLKQVTNTAFSKKIFNQFDLTIINLFKSIETKKQVQFYEQLITKLESFNEDEITSLLFTLYTYIESKFNIKVTAERLYVHYNTVRYRINLLKNYGIIPNDNEPYLPTHLGLYFYFLNKK